MAEEPGHYGKLDHSGKKKTATLPVDSLEYGKLDRVYTCILEECNALLACCSAITIVSQSMIVLCI